MGIAADGLVAEAAALAERLRGTEHEAAADRLLEQALAARQAVLGVLAVAGVAAVHVGLDIDLRESAVRADAIVARAYAS